jgi:hypothetical protein
MVDTESPSKQARAISSRRLFVEAAAIAGTGLATLSVSRKTQGEQPQRRGTEDATSHQPTGYGAMNVENSMSDEIVKARIRRALLSGPDSITRDAAVSELDANGKMTVLRPGEYHPGDKGVWTMTYTRP